MSDVKITRREILVRAGASAAAIAPPAAVTGPGTIVLEQGRYFIAGTRIPALVLLSYLVCGREPQIAAEYPFLPAGTVDAVRLWHAAEQERLNEIACTPGSVYYGLWAEEPDDPFGGMAQAVLSAWRKTGNGTDAEFAEYSDIRSPTAEPPEWWDEYAVWRYNDFAPKPRVAL